MPSTGRERTLVIHNWKAGFFSNFNGVLNNLHHRLGRDGIVAARVDWRADPSNDHFVYGRQQDDNLWLRFFEPLAFDHFPTETLHVQMYAEFAITGINAYTAYKHDRHWRNLYHALFTRHVRVRQPILDRVDAIHRAAMAGRHCVGVHYRSPRHQECPDPIPPVQAFVARVRRLLRGREPCAVVLATDVAPAIDAFRAAFGEALIVQPNVARTLHPTPDAALGEQVLTDCLLLSRCDVMLHVTSNVATAAGYMNPRMKMVYCETPFQAVKNHLDWVSWHLRRSVGAQG